MGMQDELSLEKKKSNLLLALLVSTLFYKIAVPSSFNTSVFSLLMSLPFSVVSQYTRTINIYQFPLIGICAQILVLLFSFFLLRGKLIIRPGSPIFWMKGILLIRILSYLLFSKGSFSIYYIIELVLLLITAAFVESIRLRDYSSISKKCLIFIEVYGVISAITAICYYYQVVGAQILVFRNFRISGIYPEAVSVSFLYGLAIYSALHRIMGGYGKKRVALYLIELGILFCGGLMSGSRSFLIFLAMAVLFVVFSMHGRKVWLLVIVISLLTLTAYFLFHDYFVVDIESMTDAARSQKIKIATDVFLNHPVFGVGTSNYRIYEAQAGFKGTNPHNMLFELLCENGIVGFFAYIGLILSIAQSLIRKRKKYIKISTVCIVFWFAISMVVGVFSNQFLMTLLIIFLFIIENEPAPSE